MGLGIRIYQDAQSFICDNWLYCFDMFVLSSVRSFYGRFPLERNKISLLFSDGLWYLTTLSKLYYLYAAEMEDDYNWRFACYMQL